MSGGLRYPFSFGRADHQGDAAPSGNGKAPFNLSRNRLDLAERALLGVLHRFAAGYPDKRVFAVESLWLSYSEHADFDRGAMRDGLREQFDAGLAGLAERGMIAWSGELIEVLMSRARLDRLQSLAGSMTRRSRAGSLRRSMAGVTTARR